MVRKAVQLRPATSLVLAAAALTCAGSAQTQTPTAPSALSLGVDAAWRVQPPSVAPAVTMAPRRTGPALGPQVSLEAATRRRFDPVVTPPPGSGGWQVSRTAPGASGSLRGGAVRLDGGCYRTGVSDASSWQAPLSIGGADLNLAGSGAYTPAQGACSEQSVSQLQLTLDAGKALAGDGGRFYVGTELGVWRNKFGVRGLDEAVPQVLMKYRF